MSKVKKHCPLCNGITEFDEKLDAAICESCGQPFITTKAIDVEVDDGLVNAICPNCGAKIRVDQSKEAAICESCGNAYIVSKGIENYLNNVDKKIENKKDDIKVEQLTLKTTQESIPNGYKISCAYRVEPENCLSIDEFKREALLYLAKLSNKPKIVRDSYIGDGKEDFNIIEGTPKDIADIKIIRIEEKQDEMVLVDMYYEVAYNAMVGIVPFSGNNSGEIKSEWPICLYDDNLDHNPFVNLKKIPKERIKQIDVSLLKQTELNEKQIFFIKKDLEKPIKEEIKKILPDNNASINLQISFSNVYFNKILCFQCPYYIMEYEYKGKNYGIGYDLINKKWDNRVHIKGIRHDAIQYSKGKSSLDDVVDYKSYPIESYDIKKEAKEKTNVFDTAKKIMYVVFGAFAIITFALGLVLKQYWLGFITLVPYCVCIILMVKEIKQFNWFLETSFRERIEYQRTRIKNAFNNHKLSPLSKTEEKFFSIENNKENRRILNYNKKEIKSAPIIILTIITIIMLVFGIWGTVSESKTKGYSNSNKSNKSYYSNQVDVDNSTFIETGTTDRTNSSPKLNKGENNIYVSNSITYYRFIPNNSGYYTIFTVGGYDTKGFLYNDDMLLYEDDDSGDSYNFEITYYLTRYHTYYIGVKKTNVMLGGKSQIQLVIS